MVILWWGTLTHTRPRPPLTVGGGAGECVVEEVWTGTRGRCEGIEGVGNRRAWEWDFGVGCVSDWEMRGPKQTWVCSEHWKEREVGKEAE